MILEDQNVLVTGGTGSLGKALVRRMLSGEIGNPRKIMVLSRDEAKQHDMRLEYLHRRVTTDEVIYANFQRVLEFRIGDVRDYASVARAVSGADVVVNAAALKQVPTCEYFPEEAILTNCISASNIVRAIHEHGYPVETVVGVSTDKACKPVNVMGMTKALQERILIAANVLIGKTRFIAVRYGNVLASRGSVIPLFHDQILHQGRVTLTDPEMTRFLISLDQAVDMIFAALREAQHGEIYVPLCPSGRMIDLAKALIGSRGVEIAVTGQRPGEKLHEVLISEEEIRHMQRRGRYYVISPMLPELLPADRVLGTVLTKEYSSSDDVLNEQELVALLESHRLLLEQQSVGAQGQELLR